MADFQSVVTTCCNVNLMFHCKSSEKSPSLCVLLCSFQDRDILIAPIVELCKNFEWVHVNVFVCGGIKLSVSCLTSARPWQITWILAAFLRNNTYYQVDRGALRSEFLFLSLSLSRRVYIQSSRSPSQQWSCIQWGFGGGGVSAPTGNKGHLFNLRCGDLSNLCTWCMLLFCTFYSPPASC